MIAGSANAFKFQTVVSNLIKMTKVWGQKHMEKLCYKCISLQEKFWKF